MGIDTIGGSDAMSCNCIFRRKPTADSPYCPLKSNCSRCVWNLDSGENERRKKLIKYNGLTQRDDGLRGLVICR